MKYKCRNCGDVCIKCNIKCKCGDIISCSDIVCGLNMNGEPAQNLNENGGK